VIQHCYGSLCHELGGCSCKCAGCAPAKALGYRAGEAPPITQAQAVTLETRIKALEAENAGLRALLALQHAALLLAEWGGDQAWCDACKAHENSKGKHDRECPVADAIAKGAAALALGRTR